MKKIITIGRELGSGGRTIGKMLANRLGISYYDRELIDEASKNSGLSKRYIESNEQSVTSSLLYNIAMGASYGYGILQNANQQTLPLSEQIYIAQKEIITKYANKGRCVIVGRCADQILSDRNDVLKVFIYSNTENRIERAVKEYGMTKEGAAKDIKLSDKARAQHYFKFTEKNWGERQNYDLMLNSAALGFESCVNIICKALDDSQ